MKLLIALFIFLNLLAIPALADDCLMQVWQPAQDFTSFQAGYNRAISDLNKLVKPAPEPQILVKSININWSNGEVNSCLDITGLKTGSVCGNQQTVQWLQAANYILTKSFWLGARLYPALMAFGLFRAIIRA